MKKTIFGLIALSALLGGCESMSPSECATASWRERGLQDGAAGQRDSIAAYHESCAKAGIAVDAASYRAGRAQGLQSYCRLDNAIKEGLAGRDYEGVCPAPGGENFRALHAAAHREQQARKKLAQLQNAQTQWEQELLSDKTPAKRKSTLRDQLSRSDRHLYDARDELRSAQYRLERLRYDLRQGLY